VGDVVGDVSAELAAGNLKVFSELGPIFSVMIDAFGGPGAEAPAALDVFLDSLKLEPGPPLRSGDEEAEGGQALLRSALTHYHSAMRERDPKRKAELVLLANAQVGLHEQIRLQPYIARSMTAPLGDAVTVVLHGNHLHGIADHVRHSLLSTLAHSVAHEVEQAWLHVLTRYTMDLFLPDGVLHLGRDLPNLRGGPLFPPLLQTISDQELAVLLASFGIDASQQRCAGAREWSTLRDRMRYIIELFRARQCDADLLDAPFTEAQLASMERGQLPAGPL
jgi:hypothetical protein